MKTTKQHISLTIPSLSSEILIPIFLGLNPDWRNPFFSGFKPELVGIEFNQYKFYFWTCFVDKHGLSSEYVKIAIERGRRKSEFS